MDDLRKRFLDEDGARAWFEDGRWPYGRTCPQCGSPRTARVPNEHPAPYHCTSCRSYFSVRTGTMLRASNLPLRKWMFVLHLLSVGEGGDQPVGSVTMGRRLAVNPRTAGMAVSKVRQAMTGQGRAAAIDEAGRIDATPEDMRDALLGVLPEDGTDRLPEDWEDLDLLLQESL